MNRPRPVLTAAGISSAVTSAAGILAFLGYSQQAADLSAETQAIASGAIVLVNVGVHLVAALHAQQAVTPLADPQTSDGVPLGPTAPAGSANGVIEPPEANSIVSMHVAADDDGAAHPDGIHVA